MPTVFTIGEFIAENATRRWDLVGGGKSVAEAWCLEGHLLSLNPLWLFLLPGCHRLGSLLCSACHCQDGDRRPQTCLDLPSFLHFLGAGITNLGVILLGYFVTQ